MKTLFELCRLCQGCPVYASLIGRFPTIGLLLASCFPSAVLRRIRTIIVDSSESKSTRAFTHVGEEVFKGITPTLTNGDASTPVALVRVVIGIITASFHACPAGVLRLFRLAMSSFYSADNLLSNASARLRGPITQSITPDPFLLTANAFTQPRSVSVFKSVRTNHKPIANGLSGHVYNKMTSHLYSLS
jgi:hypothetical protein